MLIFASQTEQARILKIFNQFPIWKKNFFLSFHCQIVDDKKCDKGSRHLCARLPFALETIKEVRCGNDCKFDPHVHDLQIGVSPITTRRLQSSGVGTVNEKEREREAYLPFQKNSHPFPRLAEFRVCDFLHNPRERVKERYIHVTRQSEV